MKISVIMPVYNEAQTLAKATDRVLKHKSVGQLIIVDDGSTDGSAELIKQLNHPKLTKLAHSKNLGKGAAIHTAIPKLSHEYTLIHDADLEYDPQDIDSLLEPVMQKKAVFVYGSRFKGPHTNMFFWHYLGNQFLNLLINFLYNTTLSDMESCYKLIPTSMLNKVKLTAKDFGFEPEITCQILKAGERIYEVPISYAGRDYSQGKKLHWTQGIKAATIIISQRISK